MDNTRQIKDCISRSYKAGKCDIDGNSVKTNGNMGKKPRSMGPTAVTYRFIDGKFQRVN